MNRLLPVLVSFTCVGLQAMEPDPKRQKTDVIHAISAQSSQAEISRVPSLQVLSQKKILEGLLEYVNDNDFEGFRDNFKQLVKNAATVKSDVLNDATIKYFIDEIIEQAQKTKKADFLDDIRLNLGDIFASNKVLAREYDRVYHEKLLSNAFQEYRNFFLRSNHKEDDATYEDSNKCEANLYSNFIKLHPDQNNFSGIVDLAKKLDIHPFLNCNHCSASDNVDVISIANAAIGDFAICGAMTNLAFLKYIINNIRQFDASFVFDPNAICSSGTLLHLAVYNNCSLDVFKYLIEELGVNPTIKSIEGTPAYLAEMLNECTEEALEYLHAAEQEWQVKESRSNKQEI